MKHRLYKMLFVAILFVCGTTSAMALNNASLARTILDKTAKVVGRSGGASASFTMSSASTGTISGTIVVKGRKFNARTQQAIVWFDGKTQWTYMRKNNEVNVSTPTIAQQQTMNPYTFINIYKSGYKLATQTSGANHLVHLVAQNRKQSIQEMYITINKNTYIPSVVKMKHGNKWYTIAISKFAAKNQPNSVFVFNSKDYPSAEVIDLR